MSKNGDLFVSSENEEKKGVQNSNNKEKDTESRVNQRTESKNSD